MPEHLSPENSETVPARKASLESLPLPATLAPGGATEPTSLATAEPLTPERRALLAFAPLAEHRYFTEGADQGSAETLAALERILVREAKLRIEGSVLRNIGPILFFVGLMFCISLLQHELYTLAAVLCALGAPVYIFSVTRRHEDRLERAALEYLLSLKDRRSIGLLLEQHHRQSLLQPRVDKALAQFLSALTAEELADLPPAQQQHLYGLLDYNKRDHDLALRLTLIAALDRIKPSRALAPLHALAAGEAYSKGVREVRDAAQKCLYDLHNALNFGSPQEIPGHLKAIFSIANNQGSLLIINPDILYALIHLLPQLTADTYYQILSQTDREHLYSLFVPAITGNYAYDNIRLYREIVRTLERVGDTKAIRPLQPLATMDVPSDGAKQLRAAAAGALRTLRQVAAKEKVGQTLLRASIAPGEQPEELLRPVLPSESTTAPRELLRASAPQPDDTPVSPAPPQNRKPITPAAIAKAVEEMRRQSQDESGL